MPFISSVRGSFGPQANKPKVGSKGMITGGTITTSGGYRIHTFTTTGNSVFGLANYGPPLSSEILIVGAGGSGFFNAGCDTGSGGGGAGGIVYASSYLFNGLNQTITVGAGSDNANGGDSSIGSFVAFGGGRGAGYSSNPAQSGGCGGGGSWSPTNGSGSSTQISYTGAIGYGNAGGAGGDNSSPRYGGGGGGAGSAGSSGSGSVGNGGSGRSYSLIGSAQFYAGGGGGGGGSGAGNTSGGSGGGGTGTTGTGVQGTDGLGGGGGGSRCGNNAGRGGHGTVIIRYPI